MISAVKQRAIKTTHKFGTRVLGDVDEAHAALLNKVNRNALWTDAIAKEMKKVRMAFNIKEAGEKAPVGHKEIRCHGIFDVKMDGWTRKHGMVVGGHTIKAPKTLTCTSGVKREHHLNCLDNGGSGRP
jgi:hypothetical protein